MAGLRENANLYVVPAVEQVIQKKDIVFATSVFQHTVSGADTPQVIETLSIGPLQTIAPSMTLTIETGFDTQNATTFNINCTADDLSGSPPTVASRDFTTSATAAPFNNVWVQPLISNVDYTLDTTSLIIGISAASAMAMPDTQVIDGTITLATY